ncbi:hypothetical protein CSB37_01645 [bacterium DOLZORAL124_38_8]|nr:MAG: hypothetical protein CSB37_01645 [bacterium DOLZORAL124_38_8]
MNDDFLQFHKIITDRKSVFSVSGGRVTGRDEIKLFLKRLKKDRKYAQATHNTWAARISHNGQLWETKSDDGETGASATILRVMQRAEAVNMIVVVTRWYGGIKLQGDRFRHFQDATKFFLEKISKKS